MNIQVFMLAGLALWISLASGCVAPTGTTEEESDEVTIEDDDAYVTFFLLFSDPCPPDHVGTTTYNETTAPPDGSGTCGPAIIDHIPNEQRCGIFRIHDEGFQLREGDGISVNVTIHDGPGYVTPRFVWQDDNGVVAEAVSRTWLLQGRAHYSFRASTIVDRDSSGELWFDVYSEGGRCSGVDYGWSNPSRFCTHASDHVHGVVPYGGHCTPW